MIEIYFDQGSITVFGLSKEESTQYPYLAWDDRVQKYRGFARCYREFVLFLRRKNIPYTDNAKNFEPLDVTLKSQLVPRDHQKKALYAWEKAGKNGLVVLPTGAGKTILAVLAITSVKRPTLIHVPTIDLMHQWFHVLSAHLNSEIGLLGGGYYDIKNITVATYDSANIHVERLGHKFGFLIFDECHHLTGEQIKYCALSSLAPFRLGLTATPESTPQREKLLQELTGPICYQEHIHSLTGHTLSNYEVRTIKVSLTQQEQEEYTQCRKTYTDFLKENHIHFTTGSQGQAWNQFIRIAYRSEEGKEAFQAYLKQKKIAQSSQNKEVQVWNIIQSHKNERMIIFTQDNHTAYKLGRMFFLPVLTHHTKVKEREYFLESFRSGGFKILVTSKVLNEGVDVPEASVAIVFSGSGTVREHVQRLGRILRAKEGKQAVLYELISADTNEYFINQRRREHSAYKKRTSTYP